MSQRSTIRLTLTVEESGIPVLTSDLETTLATTILKRESVSLTGSAFTALTPPSGARLVLIDPGQAVSLTLKGVTGDGAGLTVAPAASPLGAPILLPLGTAPTLGFLNGSVSAQVVTVTWLG